MKISIAREDSDLVVRYLNIEMHLPVSVVEEASRKELSDDDIRTAILVLARRKSIAELTEVVEI